MMSANSSTPAATVGAGNPSCVDNETLRIPLAVLYSVICVLGLAGNLLALWVFFCVPSKKNSVRVFLMNLAFADLLLVVCLPFRIHYHSLGNKWTLSPVLCKAVGHLFYMNMYISITLVGLISIDRYMKIYGNTGMRRRLQSTTWSTVLCVVIWIMAFGLLVPFVISTNSSDSTMCFHYRKVEKLWKAHINICLLIVFWLVFISLMVFYGRIAHKLLRRSQKKPDLPTAPHYNRTAKKSFFILFLFIICFVPYHVVRVFYIQTQITDTFCYWQNVADKANEIALVFSALNSCLDPIMFFLLSSAVRKEVRHFISSVFHTQDISGVSRTSSIADIEGRNDHGQLNNIPISNFTTHETL
ncbi:probable G-protein coupled receptor 34 [Kryptolebias marmoratus]|uniref:Probable G-protein coupled receptor 34 n=1 Tax=Kryptolebias marmoratus TaxID=37003 RepID=A0A3Q3AEX5_KRYMA|nr:probable G-protein coupled receptor 34 [Kryptolebias marmoratus]